MQNPNGEARHTAPLVVLWGSDRPSGASGMYGSHTSGDSMLAEGGVIERVFRKPDEEKFAYATV
jgi:hypothetical protein